jgi:ABC-type nitrate/sulfonate/bicarbonate transport system permease component
MRRLTSGVAFAALYGLLIFLWWLIAYLNRGAGSPFVGPVQLVRAVWDQWPVLQPSLAATAEEAALGFAAGVCLAVVLSLVTIRFRYLGTLIGRLALVLYSLPLIAIAPLLVIWFGAGLVTKVTIAALASFFLVLVNFSTALVSTDRQALEMMEVIGAPFMTVSVRVRIPYALPSLFASFRAAAPAAVIGATVAEWVGANQGLGITILSAMQSYSIPLLWSSIFVVSLLSLVSYGFFAVLGRKLFPWHESNATSGA